MEPSPSPAEAPPAAPPPVPDPAAPAEIVYAWAGWCGPCRAMKPSLARVEAEFAGRVRLSRVDADAAPEVVARLGVIGLPTFVAFRHGAEVARHAGALGEAALRTLFAQVAGGGAVARPRAARLDAWLRLGLGAAFAAIGLVPPVKPVPLLLGAVLLGWGAAAFLRR